MAALDWQRTIVDPRMPKCVADYAADQGAGFVSMKRRGASARATLLARIKV